MAIDYKNSLSRYRRYLMTVQNEPLWNASFWLSLTIILIIVMIVFFLRPTLTTIASLMGQTREQRVLLLRMDQKIATLKQAEDTYNQTKDKFVFLSQVLPEDPMWRELAESFQTIASDSGAIVEKIDVSDIQLQGQTIVTGNVDRTSTDNKQLKLPEGVEMVKFSLIINGNYEQFKNFLKKTEAVGRLLVINSARISKNKDGSLNMVIDGYAAYYKKKGLE